MPSLVTVIVALKKGASFDTGLPKRKQFIGITTLYDMNLRSGRCVVWVELPDIVWKTDGST